MMRADENLASLERLLGEPALAVVRHTAGPLSSLTLKAAAGQLARRIKASS